MFRRLVGPSTHVIKRNAGHSKWANIRHIKAEKDGERSLLFVKLCQKIKVAIQEGGNSNPDGNALLAQAIDAAKKKNMPVSSINNCVKNAQTEKTNTKVIWFDIKGPRGCYVMAQVLSDNPKRTKDTLSSILRRNGVSFADNSGKNLFDQKGVITAKAPQDSDDPLEKAIDDAIECGAEEVGPTEEGSELKFLCAQHDLQILKTKLASKKYEILLAEFDCIPKMRVELSESEMEAMGKAMDKIEDHPDVVKLFDNIA